MRFGVWSSENPIQPGAALVGNDSFPAVIVSPDGLSPPDTLGVQPVAVCWEPFGCDDGAPVEGGNVAGPALFGLLPLLSPITRSTTSMMTPSTATPARINHGALERGPPRRWTGRVRPARPARRNLLTGWGELLGRIGTRRIGIPGALRVAVRATRRRVRVFAARRGSAERRV